MAEVDLFSKNLHDSLEARNLTDIVDVVFVSDHGMTDTSHPEHIFMDDILGEEGMAAIEHSDGWPSMGLRFKPQSNATKFLDALLAASARNPEKFDVYTHDTMPERYHFSLNERIAPIYVVPRIGYVLTTHAEGFNGLVKGVGVLFLLASYMMSDIGTLEPWIRQLRIAYAGHVHRARSILQGRQGLTSTQQIFRSHYGWLAFYS